MANYYDSNFWMKFKSVCLMTWLASTLLALFKHFKTYGEPTTALSRWKAMAFQILELVDIGKDLIYLYARPHELWIGFLFAQTIILPFILNAWSTNTIKFRDKDGKVIEIRETILLWKTLMTHLGFEKKSEDDKQDPN